MKRFSIPLILCCLSVIFSFTANAERTLNQNEVKVLFTDQTASAYHELKKAPVSLYYDENGEVRGVFANGKRGTTTWHVEDSGQICLEVNGKDLCFTVVEKDGKYQKYLVKNDGQYVLVFSMETFTKGNIHHY